MVHYNRFFWVFLWRFPLSRGGNLWLPFALKLNPRMLPLTSFMHRPDNGKIMLYKELKCPIDGFELLLWSASVLYDNSVITHLLHTPFLLRSCS